MYFQNVSPESDKKNVISSTLGCQAVGKKTCNWQGRYVGGFRNWREKVLFDISNILKKIIRHRYTVFISSYTIMYQQNYLYHQRVNPLMPNDHYSGRTTPLTFKCCVYIFIQQIQVLNILNMVKTLRFFLFKMQFVS